MATAKASIKLGGSLVDPYHVSIQQFSDWHHSFEVAVSSEKIEDNDSLSIANSVSHIGKEAEIGIELVNGDGVPLIFKGIITNVHIDRSYAADSLIVFSGYSPTFLLEDGVNTLSFEEKDLKTIASTLAKAYPANLLNLSNDPKYSSALPYVVQYKETNYQFLSRMAALYGEWFYYDGQNTTFGKPADKSSVELELGKDLQAFEYGVRLQSARFSYQTHNYLENQPVENKSSSYKPTWLDNYGKEALNVSEKIFPSDHRERIYEDSPEESVVKSIVEAKKSSLLSDTTFFSGKSHNPGITVGGPIGVTTFTQIGKTRIPNLIGRYRVMRISHTLNAQKDYQNNFDAIPLTVPVPPINRHVSEPTAETQRAIVKDNKDPEKLGRIRVQFTWQENEEMTPWLRIVTPHAGADRGMYFVPEIDDEMLIGFDHGNPNYPYVLGSLFNGQAKPPASWPNDQDDFKAIKTRSGHTVLLSDQEGKESITINDKNGNTIVIDTAGNNINVTALATMTFNANNININANENIQINAGKNISVGAGENMSSSAGKNQSNRAGQSINSQAGENIDIAAQNSLSATASKTTSIKGGKKVNMAGKSIKVSGGSDIRISSADTDIL